MNNQKSAEEQVLNELKRAYTEQGILEPKTPGEKATARTEHIDEVIRCQHLELEAQVQQLIGKVTDKMASSQRVQGIGYLAREISQLLEGGEEALRHNAARLSEIVQSVEHSVGMQMNANSASMARSLLKAVASITEASTLIIDSADLASVQSSAKALANMLSERTPRQKPH